jgi:hypothetical protein
MRLTPTFLSLFRIFAAHSSITNGASAVLSGCLSRPEVLQAVVSSAKSDVENSPRLSSAPHDLPRLLRLLRTPAVTAAIITTITSLPPDANSYPGPVRELVAPPPTMPSIPFTKTNFRREMITLVLGQIRFVCGHLEVVAKPVPSNLTHTLRASVLLASSGQEF